VDIVPGRLALDTANVPDGRHQVNVEGIDAAGNVTGVEQHVNIDNHAPGKPGQVGVEGSQGWRSENGFTVRWSNPPGQVAPISRARYRLCDATACTTDAVEGVDLSSMRVRVPRAGEYALRVWLEDEAGNHDPERASDAVSLRLDDEAPTALFEHTDPGDPLAITASVDDRGAGVTTGSIEARRLGDPVWRELGARLAGPRLAAALDDAALPGGTYELRAHVRDGAGNERTTDRRRDGGRMMISLPARAATTISFAERRRCRKRRGGGRRCVVDRGPLRGNGRIIAGVLRAGGRPLPRAPIAVVIVPRAGDAPARRTTVTTDAKGRFSFPAGAGPSRAVRFEYRGTRLTRPAGAALRILVAARSSIAVSRGFALNGQAVRFRGRLRGGPIPDGGKLIDLQAFYRGRWRTFATPRTDGRGGWSYEYRFEATRGVVTYRFRARIRREAAYPYELGHSRTLRVTVRG
jgi:hypothetical protein